MAGKNMSFTQIELYNLYYIVDSLLIDVCAEIEKLEGHFFESIENNHKTDLIIFEKLRKETETKYNQLISIRAKLEKQLSIKDFRNFYERLDEFCLKHNYLVLSHNKEFIILIDRKGQPVFTNIDSLHRAMLNEGIL